MYVVPSCHTIPHDYHPLTAIPLHRCKLSKKKVSRPTIGACVFLLAHFPPLVSCFGLSLFLSTRNGKEMVSKIKKLGRMVHNKFSFFKCLPAALRLSAEDCLDGSVGVTVSLCLLLALLL